MTKEKIKKVFSIVAFPLLIIIILFLFFRFRLQIMSVFESPETVRKWVEDRGVLAPLVFIFLQIIQVIVFMIPGEVVQIAGGFVFGMWLGTLWSVIGVLLGSIINFGIGKLLGRPFAESVLGQEKMAKIDNFTGKGNTIAGFFLLFVIPGIPKDVLTYAAGASTLPFSIFIVISTVGRLPGLVGSSWMGEAMYSKNYVLAIVMFGIAAVFLIAGLVFRKKINLFIENLMQKSLKKREQKFAENQKNQSSAK